MSTGRNHTVVLAGVGGDAHFVGLTVLRRGLLRAGYHVVFLGAQNDIDDVCGYARHADAVLVSNMDGHASYYLADLVSAQREHGVADRLWYLGGHPALDDLPATLATLAQLGFDRVFHGYVDLGEVLGVLASDLSPKEPVGVGMSDDLTPAKPASSAIPPANHPGLELAREEVLAGWHSGEAARDRDGNAARLAARASLATAQRSAAAQDTILIQPRTGVSNNLAQRHLFAALEEAGADVLSFQIDSLTRNNRYEEVERILKEPQAALTSTSLLNGYPAVNHGVEAMAAITGQFRDIPFQVRHSTRDPRLLAEISFAAGISAFEGGALTYNLPYYRDYAPRHSVEQWRYVDELAGLYWSEHGITIDREFFGVLTACMVPPCLAVAVNVFEALLAAQAGVKSVTLGYAEQGHRAQDLAAVRVLHSVTRHYLATFGFSDVAVNVVWHQYMGAFPHQPEKAKQLLVGSAATASRSSAVRLMLKTWAEALRIPDVEDNRSSLQLVKQVCRDERARPRQQLGEHEQMEEELLNMESRAIIDHALTACDGDVARATVIAVEQGWLDVPFSPSRWNAGRVLPVRDLSGAVRMASTGGLPFSADLRSTHEQFVQDRLAHDRRNIEELIEDDIAFIARGEFDCWPLG